MPKFILLVYNDPALLETLPTAQYNTMMRGCLDHADELRTDGRLLESQQLEGPETARTLRLRNGRLTAVDGPFAEAKEVLGGFNIIEAEDMDDALRIAAEFPWTSTGSIEVRPVRDLNAVRRRVGAAEAEGQLASS
jgi:hypothetical protein